MSSKVMHSADIEEMIAQDKIDEIKFQKNMREIQELSDSVDEINEESLKKRKRNIIIYKLAGVVAKLLDNALDNVLDILVDNTVDYLTKNK